jgi:hypothetical protein
MDCAEIEDELLDFHFAVGSQERRDEVRMHLRQCQVCTQQFLDLKHDIDSGAAMTARPSQEARARLRADVAALFRPSLFGQAQVWLAQPTPRYRAGMAMVAMLGVVLGLGALTAGLQRRAPLPSASREAEPGKTEGWQEAVSRPVPVDPAEEQGQAADRRERRLKPSSPRWSPQVLEAYALPRGVVDTARPQAMSITYY